MTDHAEIDLRGRRLSLTTVDGDALKVALLRYLAEPAASALEDHAQLLTVTRNAESFIDPDGLLHVGAWLLDPGGGEPTLAYRMPSAGSSRQYYVASLAYPRDEWWVTSIGTKHVMGR